MMELIKQNKGKALDKLPKSFVPSPSYLISTKYDGNYVQIYVNDNIVRMFTSGGKEFYIESVAHQLASLRGSWFIEAEYVGTNGKLGDRVNSSTGSFRSKYSKGITVEDVNGKFMVFDMHNLNKLGRERAIARTAYLRHTLPRGVKVQPVKHVETAFSFITKVAQDTVKEGYEGIVAVDPSHLYIPGKRTNDIIKIKLRPTADLMCIGTNAGTGKYSGMVGSLLLEDSQGRQVAVGSGLDDVMRDKVPAYYIGKVVEIEYEQVLDTYIQPTFIRIRDKKEID